MRLPAEFGAWQDEKTSAGQFVWDAEVGDGSGRATKVKWGCFIQGLEVQPGEQYAIEVSCQTARPLAADIGDSLANGGSPLDPGTIGPDVSL